MVSIPPFDIEVLNAEVPLEPVQHVGFSGS
jgi:hypothetical protein